MFKKTLFILLSCLLVLSGSANVVMALQPTKEIEHVGNDFVDVLVNKDNGRFSIQTNQGHPLRQDDRNAPLLFLKEQPDTSFTTFRIDGEDYIFGNHYGFLGQSAHFSHRPTTQGLSNQSVWHIEGLEIVQTLTLVNDRENPNVGNVKIAYEVTNTSDETKSVGSRILLDTMLGAQDASPISLSGRNQYIRTETDLRGSSVPGYWRAADDPITPSVMSYGFLSGWDNRRPDRMVIAHWNGISATTWDYQIQDIDFTTEHNPYRSRDSAVALYWNPRSLPAGASMEFETHYGLGSFFTADMQANYGAQLFAPKYLQTNDDKDGYEEDTFVIRVEIDNTMTDAEPINRLVAGIGLPMELELDEGVLPYHTIESIDVGEIVTLSWRVRANPQTVYKAARYWVSLQAEGQQEVTLADFVVMPAVSGTPPDLQLLDVLPGKKFIDDEQKDLYLKGKGFEVLRGNWEAEFHLERERDGNTYPITYEVVDDTQILLELHSLWEFGNPEVGYYTVHLDAGDYGSFEQTIELTADTQYQSRSYGMLAIVKQGLQYSIEAVENEHALSELDGEVLLKIRGDIREISDDGATVYEVQSGATINSVIRYDDDDGVTNRFGLNQIMRVEKKEGGDEPDKVEISGTGVLSIPNFPFVMGPFKIELEDETDYALEPSGDQESIVIDWMMTDWLNRVARMASFPVTIRNAVIGEDSVSFGGTLAMKFKSAEENKEEPKDQNEQKDPQEDYNKKSTDPFRLSVDLDEARFGLNDQQNFVFQGLRAEGNVGLPKNFVPGMDFGAEARLLVDTLNHLYELEADINFEVIQLYGLFTIRLIDNQIPILDNFEFSVGGQPGIPLVPPVVIAYITSGGGGFNHLYDTVMGNFNVLPPLKLIVTGGMDIAKIIQANNMRLEASLRGISFEGAFRVAGINIFDKVYGSLLIEDSYRYTDIEAKLGASLSIFDVINGNVVATISYDSRRNGIMGPVYMSGSGRVSVDIPGSVPLVGGRSLAEVRGYISTERISASAEVIKIPVGISYRWGDREPEFEIFSMMPGLPQEDGFYQQDMHEDGEQAGTFTFGTNMSQVSSMSQWRNASQGGMGLMSMASASEDYEIPVQHQDYALFELAYSGERPELIVKDPSGDVYELIEDDNYLLQVIPADESQSGVEERYIYISVVQPEAGTWTITSNKPLDDGRLIDVAELPVIDELQIEALADHEIEVSWQSSHVNDGMEMALYVTEDGEADSGRLIMDELQTTGTTIIQLPETMASGQYYIRAALMENDELHHDFYSSTSFVVNNPFEPVQPEEVRAQTIGNGFIHVEWDFPEEADGFVLQGLDASGEALPNVGFIHVEGDLREANVGGTYEDIETGEVLGFKLGETYRIDVTAYQEVDNVRVYGKSQQSNAIYLPEPNPAQIDLSITANGEPPRESVGDHEEMIYLVNQDQMMLTMDSDQWVEARVRVNEDLILQKWGSEWDEMISLEEGVNFIEVTALNEYGDMTVSTLEVRSDTIAPDLKIESPGTVLLTSDAVVKVEGVAELGSKVTVNGDNVKLGSDGRFTAEVSMDGYLSRVITVIAEDEAGNRSVYISQVMNEAVGAIESVKIRPVSEGMDSLFGSLGTEENDNYHIIMQANASKQFKLAGIDENGNAHVLHPDRVEWDILLGHELGNISNGELQATTAGDIVLLASYRISSDYALQDTFIVRVEPDPNDGGSGTPIDYDEWYDQDWQDNYPADPPPQRWLEDESDSEIDRLLQSILRSIIVAEQGAVFLDYVELIGDEDLIISIEDRAVLKVFAQQWEDQLGIGIGKLTNPQRFMTGGKQLVGDIYELKTNKPVHFEERPELSIRFGLEDVEDPSKLAVYWYNELHQRWEYIGGEMNALQGTVTAKLPHFSKYALLYDEDRRMFSDLEGRWSSDAVYRLASIGVIDGWQHSGEWLFSPTASITRQEFIKLLVASTDVSLSTTAEVPSSFHDRDRVSPWAIPYINTAIEKGWLAGTEAGGLLHLHPLQEITRAEAAALLERIQSQLEAESSEEPSDNVTPSFKDAEQVPVWARNAVVRLEQEQILSGYPDGTFRPMNTIKREEAAVMILQFLEWNYRN